MQANQNSRNFAQPTVFNLKMNNEPFQDVQGQVRKLVSRLPDAPMASNFTARVMQAIEREEARQSRGKFFDWRWRFFLPRGAVAAVLVGLAALTFHQHELLVRQQELAKNVVLVAQQVPSVDALKNFDAIQRMGQSAHPDNQLLALASDMK